MKKTISLLVLIICFVGTGFSQEKINSKVSEPSISKESRGIRFFEGSFEDALKASKESGKPIFMDAYAPWCGPCKLMDKRIFTSERVGAFFNEHFINIRVDVDSKEINGVPNPNVRLASKYGINAYPTMFILNADGSVRAKRLGYMDVDTFIEFGKSGI